MRPVSSAKGMNASGASGTAFRMVPANERFERGHPPAAQLVDRLVVDDELAPFGGAPEMRLEVESVDRGPVHLALEHAREFLPPALAVYIARSALRSISCEPAPEEP